jgi:hypothetical protein
MAAARSSVISWLMPTMRSRNGSMIPPDSMIGR